MPLITVRQSAPVALVFFALAVPANAKPITATLESSINSGGKTVLPNELGRIPILMYHSVGEANTPYDRRGLNITPALFRKHVQMMVDKGFYPVNLRDLTKPQLSVPKGLTPVVLTFDDARGSQFRYRKDGTIDPDCAVGILDSFHRKYGARWPQRATFFALPRSKYNPTPFWQPGKEKQKVQYLVQSGYELANHSTSHRPFNRLNAKELEWEVRTCQSFFRNLEPGATMDTMAVPYGIFPRTKELTEVLVKNGNRLVCMAWGDASVAPLDERFNSRAVERIGSEPGNIEKWLKTLAAAKNNPGSALMPYVSDGDTMVLTIPKSREKYLVRERLSNTRVVAYADPVPAKRPASGKAPAGAPKRPPATS